MKHEIDGIPVNIPPRGRIGSAIAYTFRAIKRNGAMALYSAQALEGRAKRYEGKYRTAFIRFADANRDILEPGPVGPRGGWGYRYVPRQ